MFMHVAKAKLEASLNGGNISSSRMKFLTITRGSGSQALESQSKGKIGWH